MVQEAVNHIALTSEPLVTNHLVAFRPRTNSISYPSIFLLPLQPSLAHSCSSMKTQLTHNLLRGPFQGLLPQIRDQCQATLAKTWSCLLISSFNTNFSSLNVTFVNGSFCVFPAHCKLWEDKTRVPSLTTELFPALLQTLSRYSISQK